MRRADVSRVTPTALDPAHTDAVIALFHHVLPSLPLKFLRKFLAHKDVHTLVLLLPEETKVGDSGATDEDSDEDESEEEEE